MRRISSKFLIDNEEEFKDECSFAFEVLDYVEQIMQNDKSRWWFDRCYADWDTEVHFVLFTSYELEEYKDYILSIKVTEIDGKDSELSIQKKFP